MYGSGTYGSVPYGGVHIAVPVIWLPTLTTLCNPAPVASGLHDTLPTAVMKINTPISALEG